MQHAQASKQRLPAERSVTAPEPTKRTSWEQPRVVRSLHRFKSRAEKKAGGEADRWGFAVVVWYLARHSAMMKESRGIREVCDLVFYLINTDW